MRYHDSRSVREVTRHAFPPGNELEIRRVRGDTLESVLASSAEMRHQMRAAGRQLVASSWRMTQRGVTMELAFAPHASHD